MPRVCAICIHPERAAIDKALVAGGAAPRLAALYRVSVDSVDRHRQHHLAAGMIKAQEQEDVAHALDVVKQLKAANTLAWEIATKARSEDPELVLKALDRIMRQIEVQAKMLDLLDERPVVNILVSPEWVAVRGVLLAALAPFPQARQAAAAALLPLEQSNGRH